MVNILLFADVRKRFRITIDTEVNNCLLVHTGKHILRFSEVGSGVNLFDRQRHSGVDRASAFSFLTLAQNNRNQFSKKEIKGANKAVALHESLGCPGYQEFFRLLRTRHVIDCPVT